MDEAEEKKQFNAFALCNSQILLFVKGWSL